jgi:23S rRNA (uridine2552-2'-O)-methyltransferase
MGYKRKDHFHKKAKSDGYRSRAVYKLQEIQKRFRLFRQGNRVLDIGAAPGGWLQAVAEYVGKKGSIVGVDLLPIDPLPLPQVQIILGDVNEPEVREETLNALGGKAHVVLSDMAPNTTGIRITDCARSHDLACIAFDMAMHCLRPGGHFVVKIFPGSDFEDYLGMCKQAFRKVKTTKPEATRKASVEVYVICTDFKGPPEPNEEETTQEDGFPVSQPD